MLKSNTSIRQKLSQLEDIRIFFEELKSDLQSKWDDKSEKYQESEKGEEESENIDKLGEIAESLETSYNELEEIFE